ncbi:E7 early protein [Bos taurus papillomavirus 33]|nr:E7 early protein [Bos taurus papillomavirus 33]
MVAGPPTSRNLPEPKVDALILTLTPDLQETEDKGLDFADLHAEFTPPPAKPPRVSSLCAAKTRRGLPQRNYYLSCACQCGQRLSLAVKANYTQIRTFQELLIGPGFTLLCSFCGQ